MEKEPRENLLETEGDLDSELHEKSLGEIDLSKLASDLKKYNDSFNIFRLVGRSMTEAIGKERDGVQEESFEERAKKERVESFNNLLDTYRSDLARTGLNLESVKSRFFTMSNTGEMQGTEMRINVLDGKKFIDYLESLDKNNITNDQVEGLKSVAEILTKQLAEEYDLSDPSDERMVEFMGNFAKIIELYKQFTNNPELVKSVEELSKYLKISKGKYLKEYLLAEREHLLTEPGIGAEGPEDYKQKLKEALEFITQIGKNPNAKNFYQELIEIFKEKLKDRKEELKGWGKKYFEEQEAHMKDPAYVVFSPRTLESFEEEEQNYKIIIDEMYDVAEDLNN